MSTREVRRVSEKYDLQARSTTPLEYGPHEFVGKDKRMKRSKGL